MALTGKTNEERIWNYLIGKGLTAYGAAGLMGNLYAESGLNPKNLQNTYERNLGFTDAEYTAAVDAGTYSNLVRDAAGYGLAQWTYWSRKALLLAYVRAAGASIGDLEAQLGFLCEELADNYGGVWNRLKKATSVQAASDAVLLQYERPADQSDRVKDKRASYGQKFYDKFAGTGPETNQTGGDDMSVKIAHASGSENGTITGNAGDQTGKEVCIRNWYLHSKGWVLIRCKDPAMRPYIAEAAEAAAKNDHIGYDQSQNQTLYQQAKGKGFDPAKVAVDVETDCARLVRVCAQYACKKVGNGKTIPDFYTASEPTVLKNTGLFELLTDAKYTTKPDYLMRGDILCTKTKGHTVVVISDGSKVEKTDTSGQTEKSASSTGTASGSTSAVKVESAQGRNDMLAGTYTTTGNLNMRTGAGTGKKVILTIPKGKKVQNYGYYSKSPDGVLWLYVSYDGKTGFCSTKYLKKG